MPHMFFFSYASENWNQPGLEDFYSDLCQAVAPLVTWNFNDPEATLIEENQALIAGADELMRELVDTRGHGSWTSTMSK